MEIPQILKELRNIAVVGASPNPDRTSNQVLTYMKKHGYKIFPVNPNTTEVSGQKCYPSLEAVPEKIDIVNIFRRY
jgi:predicted CoA-binding protein